MSRRMNGTLVFSKKRGLSGPKVFRILTRMGVDTGLFETAYLNDRSAGAAFFEIRDPTPDQIAAVKAFMDDGDIKRLMRITGYKSTGGAEGLVSRTIRYMARAGGAHS